MNKKVLIIVLILIVLVVGAVEGYIVFGGKKNNNQTNETGSSKTSEVASNEWVFTYEGMNIEIGKEFTREKYGEEKSYSEIQSCAFDGLDKTYTYDHYEITTYPAENEKENILSVYFLDETIATNEGVSIGDSYDKMIETYSEDFENHENSYTYRKGETLLNFIVENETITSIEYTLDVEE